MAGTLLLKSAFNMNEVCFHIKHNLQQNAVNIQVQAEHWSVDDMVDSRWTFTLAAWLLRSNGGGEVWPLALAQVGH